MSYEQLNKMLGNNVGMRVSMSTTNPYRIIGERKDCYEVLYSSSPVLDSQTGEPVAEKMEFNSNNMYKGIQTELKLNSTSFEKTIDKLNDTVYNYMYNMGQYFIAG